VQLFALNPLYQRLQARGAEPHPPQGWENPPLRGVRTNAPGGGTLAAGEGRTRQGENFRGRKRWKTWRQSGEEKRGDFIPEDSPERKKISVENLC